MFNRAIEWNLFSGKNPVGKLPRIYQRKPIILTAQVIQDYLSACPGYYYPTAATLICTGMRSGELLNLKWSDIDFDREMIWIRSDSSRKNDQGRSVPIFPDLLKILLQLPHSSQFVFPGISGAQRSHFRRGHERARSAIGLPDIRIHDLRHAFITLLLQEGFDIPAVAKLAGHKSTKVTTEIYHHLNPDHARKIINGLPITLSVTGSQTVAETCEDKTQIG